MEISLLYLGHLAAEHLGYHAELSGGKVNGLVVLFCYQVVDGVTVNPLEAAVIAELLFKHAYHGDIQLVVHEQDAVALVPGGLDVSELFLPVGGVEIYQALVLVGLVGLDEFPVLLICEIGAVRVLEEGHLLHPGVEILLGEHSVVDEELDIVPLPLELLAVTLEYGSETVGHLLGDVARYLLDVGVTLKIRTGNVQRDVRRIYDTWLQ